jgi:hypothetical protein
MRYNSELLEIKVVISGNVPLFKDVKISLGPLFTGRKKHTLFRVNHNLDLSTANNRMRVAVTETKISSKSCLVLSIVLDQKVNNISLPFKASG